MMKRIVLISMLFWISSTTSANEILISLYEHDPWRMVIGSDSPTFVLYEDGQTIFWDAEQNRYQFVMLNEDSIRKELSELRELSALKEEYELSNWTDQPTQVLSMKIGQKFKRISIYGNLRKEKEVRAKTPKLLLSKFDHLVNYHHSGSKAWVPEYLEVMIWPYEYAPDASIQWPSVWPDINSEGTKKRGNAYSIYLPYKYLEEFKKFIETRNEKGAVEINGKKWAVSTRIPFPHEMALNK
jgi:hypothetical protein